MTAFATVVLTCDSQTGCAEEFTRLSSKLETTRRSAEIAGWQAIGTHDYCPDHIIQATDRA